MKIVPLTYIFDASAQTIQCDDFTNLERIAIITNVTDGIIIYNFADSVKGGTLAGDVLTLEYDTTAMADADKLQIILHPEIISTATPNDGDEAVRISSVPQRVERIGFTKAVSSNVDSDFLEIIGSIGSGMGVNQTGGNLVITAGTTARSETIIRSLASFKGGVRLRSRSTLSQRIANNNFFVELVDVIGDGLAYTIGSATAITVTFPAGHGFTAQNVGQSMYLGGFAGTGTFLSGRYVIASVSGDDITFTVSGFAVGTGTCSAFGHSYYQLQYQGTTATQVAFDTQRKGYASGATTATISTTASPGHVAVITGNDGIATFADQLVASGATIKQTVRATRDEMVPDDIVLRLQIRIANGSTNPASGTTWTIGQMSVSEFAAQDIVIQDMRPMGVAMALPVEIMRASGTVATTMAANATTTPAKARDGVAGGTDTGIPSFHVRRDIPTAVTPIAGDYEMSQIDDKGRQYVVTKAPTSAVTSVSGSASSVSLLASNNARVGATVYNDSAAILYIKLGATASATSFTVKVQPEEYFEVPFGYTGAIDGIWASATGSARITELT
jgi:hypothetical protein